MTSDTHRLALSGLHREIMAELATVQPAAAGAVADVIGVPRGQVSAGLDYLAAYGLAESETYQRRAIWKLTPRGQDEADRAR